MNDDIWFDLCIGNITVDDDGARHFRQKYSRMSQITAWDVRSVAQYRDVLHVLLDKAIDYIEANQRPVRK
jgi:hypothetical protein